MPTIASRRHVVYISSPLEVEHVERIRAVAPAEVEVVHDPDLLPPTRYQGDHKGREDFVATPEQRARRRAHLARATILWDFPPGAAADGGGLAHAPLVRWVQTTSSGVGQLVHSLGLAGTDLLVTTARGVHAEPLAEFVMLAILAHAKDFDGLRREQRLHHWQRYCARSVAGERLAIVGAGKVGARIGSAARAFGIHVTAVVNRPAAERAAELNADVVRGSGELHSVLAEADHVVLCLPHTPQTERMIDGAAIAAMKRGATLVNIARGHVIDERALIAALASGHIGFAALDVAEVEPLPADSPLWDLPNVLISPHSASTVASENARITDIFTHNLACYLQGRRGEMLNVLDKARFY